MQALWAKGFWRGRGNSGMRGGKRRWEGSYEGIIVENFGDFPPFFLSGFELGAH